MEDLDKIMQYAVRMEFNGPRNQGEAAVIAIAFAGTDYCRKTYFLFKENFKGQKLTATIEVTGITLNATFLDKDDQITFKANLNYDKIYLREFIKSWPPGQPIALAFGVTRQCQFYLINPEKCQSDFSVFVLNSYEFIEDKL